MNKESSLKEWKKFMRAALAEARRARKEGEVPVGAVIVKEKKIIARAHNQPIKKCDPSAHAEVLVLRRAARKLKNYRLNGCDLYVTIEPCAMCVGAAIQARVDKIIFGAKDQKAGACGSVLQVAGNKKLNHRVKIISGVLEVECRSLIQNFFKARRAG